MAGKRIEVYQSIKTVHECRLYSNDIRSLFHLPFRKGKIIGTSLHGQLVTISFEIERHRAIPHKLTGGK